MNKKSLLYVAAALMLFGCEDYNELNFDGYKDLSVPTDVKSINYTLKTQYIYRISKGILDVTDDYNLNREQNEKLRRIAYRNMIYIGDGMTDIPCMKMLKEKGGKSIALYPAGNSANVTPLVEDERINYVCVADYSPDSPLEKIVKLMIEHMAVVDKLKDQEETQLSQFKQTKEK